MTFFLQVFLNKWHPKLFRCSPHMADSTYLGMYGITYYIESSEKDDAAPLVCHSFLNLPLCYCTDEDRTASCEYYFMPPLDEEL